MSRILSFYSADQRLSTMWPNHLSCPPNVPLILANWERLLRVVNRGVDVTRSTCRDPSLLTVPKPTPNRLRRRLEEFDEALRREQISGRRDQRALHLLREKLAAYAPASVERRRVRDRSVRRGLQPEPLIGALVILSVGGLLGPTAYELVEGTDWNKLTIVKMLQMIFAQFD